MWYYLENFLRDKFCESNKHCAFKELCKANEKLKKELYILQDVKENFPLICDYINSENQTVYIKLSANDNGIVYVNPIICGNKITGANFYGRFGINSLSKRGDLQRVYTELRYDGNDIVYCDLIDFLCRGNRGYGTIMMTCLINYFKTLNVKYIKGFVYDGDVHDTNDKEHGDRLYHFYKKFGFHFYTKGDVEYMKLDLQNDNKMCERKYIEQSIYETENDCYKTLVNKLLISNNLQISELSHTLRIQNPNYYVCALKSCKNANSMIEDLTLLCKDIDSLESNSIQRKRLLERLDSFINPLRYFSDNKNLMLFSEKIRNEYF